MLNFAGFAVQTERHTQYRKEECKRISNAQWKSDKVKAIKIRLNESTEEFRNKAISHKLTKELDEYTVSLVDISSLIDAGIELLDILSFYPLDFYRYRVDRQSFMAEKLCVSNESKRLLDLLILSSPKIKSISVDIEKYADIQEATLIREFIDAYNEKRVIDDKYNKAFAQCSLGLRVMVKLHEVDEFVDAILKADTLNDGIVVELINQVKRNLEKVTDGNDAQIAQHKVHIIDQCLDNIKAYHSDLSV